MIRLAEERDIDQVMPFMLEDELSRLSLARLSPRDAIKASLGPFTYSGVVQDKVVCMFGVRASSDIGEFPTLWLIKTPLVHEHKIEFLRENVRFIRRIMKQFGVLESCVLKSNSISLNWLAWLGFRPIVDAGEYVRMRLNA